MSLKLDANLPTTWPVVNICVQFQMNCHFLASYAYVALLSPKYPSMPRWSTATDGPARSAQPDCVRGRELDSHCHATFIRQAGRGRQSAAKADADGDETTNDRRRLDELNSNQSIQQMSMWRGFILKADITQRGSRLAANIRRIRYRMRPASPSLQYRPSDPRKARAGWAHSVTRRFVCAERLSSAARPLHFGGGAAPRPPHRSRSEKQAAVSTNTRVSVKRKMKVWLPNELSVSPGKLTLLNLACL